MTNNASESLQTVKRRRWLLLGAIIAFALLFIVGLGYYWHSWYDARVDLTINDSAHEKTSNAFWEDILAGRLESAYKSTTTTFQRHVSSAAFEEAVHRYLAFKKKPGARGIQHRSRSGENWWISVNTMEDGEGNGLEWSITIVREDSIFHLRPPPPQVSEFTVREVPPNATRKP